MSALILNSNLHLLSIDLTSLREAHTAYLWRRQQVFISVEREERGRPEPIPFATAPQPQQQVPAKGK